MGSIDLAASHVMNGPTKARDLAQRLRVEVVGALQQKFVGRDEVIELIALAIVSGEHLLLHGPPGTAKSAAIRQFAARTSARYFEYLLTRFSEPNEVFGPIDLAQLKDGRVATVTTGMLPEAEFVFLDELFNANSALLNNLLSVLNERVYRRGSEVHKLPMISFFSATNQLPEDDALKALFDRFLLRCHVENLPRASTEALLAAGWALERADPADSSLSVDELRALAARTLEVDLSGVLKSYANLVFQIRDLGVGLSDRRAVKALKLIAASAVLRGKEAADESDFWVLRYLWDRREQIGPLRSLIDGVLEAHPKPADAHPLAKRPERVDPEALAREIELVKAEVDGNPRTIAAVARLRERIAALSDQAAWTTDPQSRKYLLEQTSSILKRLG